MKPGLFRREVTERQGQIWLGEIQLARPLSLAWSTAFVAAAALSVAALLFAGEYTRKSRLQGVLVPDRGVLQIVPPQPALLLERRVSEGQAVRRGETLFVLSLEQTSPLGDTQAAVQRSLDERRRSLQDGLAREQALQASRQDALARRAAALQGEAQPMQAQARLLDEQLALAERALVRLQALRGQNFVSEAQVQARQEEVLALRGRVQAQALARAAHEREIAGVQAELRELPLRAQALRGALERDLAELAQEAAHSEAQRRLLVVAPSDGVLGAVVAEPGQPVSPASTLATLLPADARLTAQLWAPSSAVGFLRPQQSVRLRYQAFPYQKFGHQEGRVIQVSRAPLPAGESGVAGGEPMYRVTVALQQQTVLAYGQPHPLVAGMRLDADVLLDRRRLVEWLFEPLLGMAGRL